MAEESRFISGSEEGRDESAPTRPPRSSQSIAEDPQGGLLSEDRHMDIEGRMPLRRSAEADEVGTDSSSESDPDDNLEDVLFEPSDDDIPVERLFNMSIGSPSRTSMTDELEASDPISPESYFEGLLAKERGEKMQFEGRSLHLAAASIPSNISVVNIQKVLL
mmetsp:Transcript_43539/g.113350  ORF Transcript_43539/g.113350 Transcript_43539/m.113350 type:complete len:163 (+) Transcript_43539:225-713(+)